MHGRVTTTERLTPGMVRVTLGGGDLEHLVDARRHGRLRQRGLPSCRGDVRRGVRPAGRPRHPPGRATAGAAPLHGARLGSRGPPADDRLRRARRRGGRRAVGGGGRSRRRARLHRPERRLPAGPCRGLAPVRRRRVGAARPSPPRSRRCPPARARSSDWCATAPSTRSRCRAAGTSTSGGSTAAATRRTSTCWSTRCVTSPSRRAAVRVRPRRGRRDPRRPPPPAARPGPDPAGPLLLAVLAPDDDRRGLAPDQARLRRRHGGRGELSRSQTPSRSWKPRWAKASPRFIDSTTPGCTPVQVGDGLVPVAQDHERPEAPEDELHRHRDPEVRQVVRRRRRRRWSGRAGRRSTPS